MKIPPVKISRRQFLALSLPTLAIAVQPRLIAGWAARGTSERPPFGSYGAGPYGQGLYGSGAAPYQTYLPVALRD